MARRPTRPKAQNRYASANEPQATLDFHNRPGLAAKQVHHEVLAFIMSSKAQGHRRLRIITGKGLHSQGEPVVAPQVQRTLRRLEVDGTVQRVVTERLDQGGAGALRVDLA